MTESLQNKNKLTKKEAGGDEKHVYFFIRPYTQVLMKSETRTAGRWVT